MRFMNSVLLLSALSVSATSLAASVPSDYYSLHQLPYTQFQDKTGNFISLSGGYKNYFNYKDPFVGCNLGLLVNDKCGTVALTNEMSYTYVQVDARKPAINLSGKFKIWLPAGLKALDVTGYMPQNVYSNVRVRLGQPLASDPPFTQIIDSSLPENNLARMVKGEEFNVGGTTNGSIEVSSKPGRLSTPLAKGAWLYFAQSGTSKITFISISLTVDSAMFKADYDNLIFGADGDPSTDGIITPPGTTTTTTTTSTTPTAAAFDTRAQTSITKSAALIQGVNVSLSSDDSGKASALYVMAQVGKELYIQTPSAGWRAYGDLLRDHNNGLPVKMAFSVTPTKSTAPDRYTFDIIQSAYDLQSLVKQVGQIRFLIGYGLGSNVDDPGLFPEGDTSAFFSMMSRKTFAEFMKVTP